MWMYGNKKPDHHYNIHTVVIRYSSKSATSIPYNTAQEVNDK
jgi:hypothetical protein